MDEDLPVQNTATPGQQEPPKKSFPIKTLLLILVLAVIAGGLLMLAFSQNQQSPTVTQIPTVTPDPVQTVLTASSVVVPLASPSAYQTDVIINTGQNKINSVQLELSYDPSVLKTVDIVPGGFFAEPLVKIKNIDTSTGRITYVLNVSTSSDEGALGQGIIAQIRFFVPKTQKATQTFIKFEPKTQVLGVGFSNSLLKSTVDATFTVGALAIPTRIPTATPSGTTGR